MKRRTLAPVILGWLCLISSARADTMIDSYTAFLSGRDHFNSSGARLDNVAAIIRQDRANFHKFGRRDDGDESDQFFAVARNREILESFLKRGKTTKAVMDRIVNGTPSILVRIFEADNGEHYINVLIAE